jgi:hypothetical protein
VKSHYYHPSQHGSWSIKAVLHAIAPDLKHGDLEGVKDGVMAMTAYREAIRRLTGLLVANPTVAIRITPPHPLLLFLAWTNVMS